MANQQLLDYIKQQLEEGIGREEIKNTLIKSGWTHADVDEGFLSIEPSQEAPTNTEVPHPSPVASSIAETNISTTAPVDSVVSTSTLIGTGELYRRSWNIYRSRFWVLMGISISPFLIAFILGLLSVFFVPSGAISFIIRVISFLFFVGVLWSYVSLLYAVKDSDSSIGIIESFRMGWKKLLSYWWIMILEGIIIMGGVVLLIIPSVIFFVWFFLSAFVLVSEETKGLDALMKSKEYVRGRWWGVFGRVLVLFIPIIIFAFVVSVVLKIIGYSFDSIENNIAMQIIDFFILPFYLVYGFSLYKSLKEVRGEFVFDPKKGRGKFIAVGILGGILIPIAILSSVILINLNAARTKGLNAERTIQINKLKTGNLNSSINEEFIKSVVAGAKSRTSFPLKIDDTKTLVDIIAKPNTVFYKYIMKDSIKKWSDSFLKDSMIASLCNAKGISSFLDRGIGLEYSVLITNTNKTYTASIYKEDCAVMK